LTAKEYLKQARMLDMEINCKQEELHQLRLKATCVQSVVISDRVQSSHENSSNQVIDKILDLQREINAEICKLVELKSEIRKKISAINSTMLRIVLTEYYLNIKTWAVIAEKYGYTERNIHYLHGCALKEFNKVASFQ
jgi:DNA-directed RNA polymerase specialized sigma subunit